MIETLNLMSPLPYKFPDFVVELINTFNYYERNRINNKDLFKDIFIEIAEFYMKIQHYYVFDRIPLMLQNYIHLNKQKSSINKNLEILLAFFENYRKNN